MNEERRDSVNFEQIPIISHCSVFQNIQPKRPLTIVPGRSFSSLSLRLRGETRIRGEGCDLLSGPGTLTYVPSGYTYRTEASAEGEILVMHFSASRNLSNIPVSVPVPFPTPLRNLFENAAERYTAKGCDLVLMSLAYQLLAEAKHIYCPGLPVPHRLKQCKHYMDENITDPTLRVRDLAEMCGTSEVWFRKEFAKYYGKSPLEYIKEKRLETAKLLLQTGLYTVTEVASRAGFESSSYFSAEFRHREGIPPREYKEKRK